MLQGGKEAENYIIPNELLQQEECIAQTKKSLGGRS